MVIDYYIGIRGMVFGREERGGNLFESNTEALLGG